MKCLLLGLFLSLLTLNTYSTEPQDKHETAEIECLTKVIYHEARGESEKGKIAVALVTMNRTKSNKFPDTVCGVVKQRTKKVCQFTWQCTKHKVTNFNHYLQSKLIARNIYKNYSDMKDITHGALYFRVSKSKNWNKLKLTTQIGSHAFYKPHK